MKTEKFMKNFFIALCMVLFFVLEVKAELYAPTEFVILDKKYDCYTQSCYDVESFKHNKITDTYSVNMLIDLMNLNRHDEYPSIYDEGYVSHMIYKITLHKNKIFMKCIGYISRKVIASDKDPTDFYFIYLKRYNKAPAAIPDSNIFAREYFDGMDLNLYKLFIKNLVNGSSGSRIPYFF